MSNELRTLFVDSAQAERQSDGSFRIILREQMEVDIENVLYLDDLWKLGFSNFSLRPMLTGVK